MTKKEEYEKEKAYIKKENKENNYEDNIDSNNQDEDKLTKDNNNIFCPQTELKNSLKRKKVNIGEHGEPHIISHKKIDKDTARISRLVENNDNKKDDDIDLNKTIDNYFNTISKEKGIDINELIDDPKIYPLSEIKKKKEFSNTTTNNNKQEIQTILRIRPCPSTSTPGKYTIKNNSKSLEVVLENNTKTFSFTKAFSSEITQKDFFEATCVEALENFFDSFKSGIIFTYGMTCSGKTYTVVGDEINPGILPQSLEFILNKAKVINGLSGNACKCNRDCECSYNIDKYANIKVSCQYYEIYNEECYDLLYGYNECEGNNNKGDKYDEDNNDIKKKSNRTIKRNKKKKSTNNISNINNTNNKNHQQQKNNKVNIKAILGNLPANISSNNNNNNNNNAINSTITEPNINNLSDFNKILLYGTNNKTHAFTALNDNSSRSHTIFKIILTHNYSKKYLKTIIEKNNIEISTIELSGNNINCNIFKNSEYSNDLVTFSTNFSIIDLAGSERAKRTEATGINLIEAAKINSSLSVLGKCLEAMRFNSSVSNIKKKVPVPFRESKLTLIFQQYFSGEHFIMMITNINPRKEDYEESVRALSFSCLCKEIIPNKSVVIRNTLIRDHKAERKKILLDNSDNYNDNIDLNGVDENTTKDIEDNIEFKNIPETKENRKNDDYNDRNENNSHCYNKNKDSLIAENLILRQELSNIKTMVTQLLINNNSNYKSSNIEATISDSKTNSTNITNIKSVLSELTQNKDNLSNCNLEFNNNKNMLNLDNMFPEDTEDLLDQMMMRLKKGVNLVMINPRIQDFNVFTYNRRFKAKDKDSELTNKIQKIIESQLRGKHGENDNNQESIIDINKKDVEKVLKNNIENIVERKIEKNKNHIDFDEGSKDSNYIDIKDKRNDFSLTQQIEDLVEYNNTFETIV